MEKSPLVPQAPIIDINVSEGWDTQSQIEIFLKALRELPFYRPGLLYSGFNADHIGVKSSGKLVKGAIFCAPEQNIEVLDDETNNPFLFAATHNRSAISVYDPLKLRKLSIGEEIGMSEYDDIDDENTEAYKIIDSSALIATIRINFKKPKSI